MCFLSRTFLLYEYCKNVRKKHLLFGTVKDTDNIKFVGLFSKACGFCTNSYFAITPYPIEPEAISDSGNPIVTFVDTTAPPGERLAALESIEPELLDETEIGRVLLGLQKTITDGMEDTLQKAAFNAIGLFSENVPNQFQNFTAPLLVTGK